MKNTLGDLNNHLFAQLERLSDEELKGDDLREELGRAKAITSIASQVIANGHLVLNAKRTIEDSCNGDTKIPKMLEA